MSAGTVVPILGAALIGLSLSARADGNTARGEPLYVSRGFGCHAVDAHRVGPKHRGVFGRRAGSAEGYIDSPALKVSTVVWNETALDQWLTDPQALIPGQRMNIRAGAPRVRGRAAAVQWLSD